MQSKETNDSTEGKIIIVGNFWCGGGNSLIESKNKNDCLRDHK